MHSEHTYLSRPPFPVLVINFSGSWPCCSGLCLVSVVKCWCVDKRFGCHFGCGSRLQVKVPVVMIHMRLLYMCDWDAGGRGAVHNCIHKVEEESSFDFTLRRGCVWLLMNVHTTVVI